MANREQGPSGSYLLPEDLEAIARRVFGHGWQTALAERMSCHRNQIGLMARGRTAVPVTLAVALVSLAFCHDHDVPSDSFFASEVCGRSTLSPEEFTDMGRRLFGRGWMTALGRHIDYTRVQIGRFANGGAPIPATVAMAAQALVFCVNRGFTLEPLTAVGHGDKGVLHRSPVRPWVRFPLDGRGLPTVDASAAERSAFAV